MDDYDAGHADHAIRLLSYDGQGYWLCGANSFDYLTELQRHARELTANPAKWMPWNYRQTLEPPGV